MRTTNLSTRLSVLAAMTLLVAVSATAQTTQFTYQGKLADTGSPANGQYDFQFKLFDTPTVGGGTQQGGPVTASNVAVTGGIFTVQIDFGVCPACFNGSARFLEIAVKLTSDSTFTTLGPRQPVTSNPYAIRSLNAGVADGLSVSCVNCVTSSQIQSVQGSQVTGNIAGSQVSGLIPVSSVPAGSGNYVQNTTVQQASSNFNISGTGTAAGTLSGNVVNASTQYNLNGSRVLSNGGSLNLFAGVNAGNSNIGGSNSFFGFGAGQNNTTGQLNSFFGTSAGGDNTTGSFNSFFGQGAGQHNAIGHDNAFFGTSAGLANAGDFNSFFGSSAGQSNAGGQQNSYFGYRAGFSSTTGGDNAFFGFKAGLSNTAGLNAFFGSSAGEHNTSGVGNSFFGNHAGNATSIGISNSFFGSNAGATNTGGGHNSFFGSGTGADSAVGDFNSFFGDSAGIGTSGSSNTFIGANTGFEGNSTGDDDTTLGYGARALAGVSNSTAIGSGALVTASHTIMLGTDQEVVDVPGKLQIDTLGTAGSTQLCLNGSNRVAPCSSSLRYKTGLRPFAGGLEIINRLRPISFTWKDGEMRDVGLGAEDVARVEPLLTFNNSKGEIEGVKYNQLSVVFINAFKQQQGEIIEQQTRIKEREREASIQQAQIELYRKQLTLQQRQIRRQQYELESLKRMFYPGHTTADASKSRRHTR